MRRGFDVFLGPPCLLVTSSRFMLRGSDVMMLIHLLTFNLELNFPLQTEYSKL